MGHNGPITAVTFSNDGEYFASGGSDKQVNNNNYIEELIILARINTHQSYNPWIPVCLFVYYQFLLLKNAVFTLTPPSLLSFDLPTFCLILHYIPSLLRVIIIMNPIFLLFLDNDLEN